MRVTRTYFSLFLTTLTIIVGYGSYGKGTLETRECGVKKSSSRIVGGRDSGGYHYPWFALLVLKENEDFPVCAGSLITLRHILTAAHCFSIKPSTPNEELFKVLMGIYDRCNHSEPRRQVFTVLHVDVHEEYRNDGKFHDIALMTLDRPADYTVICLPFPGMADATEPAVLIGYGVTRQGGRKAPCHMMEADITKYSKSDCQKTDLPEEDVAEGSVICAGRIKGGTDSCQGDSGGPLQTVTSVGKYVIAGIVSYGYGCANPGLPGIYTNVASYLPWIGSRVSDHESSRKSKHSRFYDRTRTPQQWPISGSRVVFPDDVSSSENGETPSERDFRDLEPEKNEFPTGGVVQFPRERNSGRRDFLKNASQATAVKESTVIFPNGGD